MKKRWIIWISVALLVALGISLAVPDSRGMIQGLLRGEPWFEGRPANYWMTQLRDKSKSDKVEETLLAGGPDVIPVLLYMRTQESESAYQILRRKGISAVPTLVDCLSHPKAEMRYEAARILADMTDDREGLEQENEAANKVLMDLLQDEGSRALWPSVARTLYSLGEDPRRAAPQLIKLLNETNRELREKALFAYRRLASPEDRAAIPALRQFLTDPTLSVRLVAILTLHKISPGDPDLLSEYLTAVKDDSIGVRVAAYKALIPFGASARPGFSELVAQLEKKTDIDLLDLAIALGSVESSDPEVAAAVVSVLQEFIDDRDPRDRILALKSLHKTSPANPDLLSKYLTALKDENVLVRAAAYEALVPFGASARPGFSELIDQLKNTNDIDRLNLAIALGVVQPSDPEIFEAAVSVLQKLSDVPAGGLTDISMRAAAALGHIKETAKRSANQ